MFHSVFCAGSKYPQEAKLISETKKKKNNSEEESKQIVRWK